MWNQADSNSKVLILPSNMVYWCDSERETSWRWGLGTSSHSMHFWYLDTSMCTQHAPLFIRVAWMLGCLGFIHTLKIITRILREVVNRERLCGTSACMTGFRNLWGCQTPCRSTDTLYLCLGCWSLRWCSDAEMGRGKRPVLYSFGKSTFWRSWNNFVVMKWPKFGHENFSLVMKSPFGHETSFLSVMKFFGHETSFSSVMKFTPCVTNFTPHVMNQQITFWSWNDHSGHEIFHLHESHSGHVNHILVMKISPSWITFWSWKIHRLNHIWSWNISCIKSSECLQQTSEGSNPQPSDEESRRLTH